MSVNANTAIAAAPTAPPRASKPAVSTSGEGFGAMVADAVAETSSIRDDKTVSATAETSSDTGTYKTSDASREADSVLNDTSEDAASSGFLNGAALFAVPPQPQTVTNDPEANGAIHAESTAKSGVDLLQTAADETTPAADALKAVAQPTAAAVTAAATAALSKGIPPPSGPNLPAEAAMQGDAGEDGAAPRVTGSSTQAAAHMVAPRLAASASGTVVSNAAAGSAKTESQIGDQPAEASDPAPGGVAQAAVASATAQSSAPQALMSQSQPAAISAFAALIQAQSQATETSVTPTTDTVPTGQNQLATQAASTATAPVIASFSSLSRATLDTTVQIAAQITRQLAGRSTRFEMGLTPEGLGKVNVSMDIDADGQLTAQLAFDNPLAAADMRARADELRGQLQDAGFKLTDDALTFSQQDASASEGGDQRPDQNQGRAFASASRVAADAEAILPVPAWVSLSLTPRGVDMKV